ncbi:MAG: pyridoxal phosphate-dependent aminotransferase family protein [Flavobacteriaceae bacterium]
MRFPKKLSDKLKKRIDKDSLRHLPENNDFIDFSSNDYLGISKSKTVFEASHSYLLAHNIFINGATGSRLLSGNHKLYHCLEQQICEFHQSEAALVFNSGYDANIGFFSSVPQRGDLIFYDEFIHASVRDGIKMSDAKSYKFTHNNIKNLEDLFTRHSESNQAIFVVTESVFSMDGDCPDLVEMSQLVNAYEGFLIVDEAHAVGLFGERGYGIVQDLNITADVFARIITFGKALGSHGAAILGSKELKQYLINFSRSFMYTTGLSPHTIATTHQAYDYLQSSKGQIKIEKLKENITFFKEETQRLTLQDFFIQSNSAIHCCMISGNEIVKKVAAQIQNKGFDVKPILSPTIPEGQERLRFCLHSYNSKEEITKVLETLCTFVLR